MPLLAGTSALVNEGCIVIYEHGQLVHLVETPSLYLTVLSFVSILEHLYLGLVHEGPDVFACLLVANRSAVVSLLSFVCLFLGFHTLGLYVHNDVMQALGSPEKQLALLPVLARC